MTKPITRTTVATVFEKGKDRPVVIRLDPDRGILYLRAKGLRTEYPYDIGLLYWRALQRYADQSKPPRKKLIRRGLCHP